ncbi:hypothetical protein ACHAQA_007176 [Verticillium albo-atrum]
MVLMLVEEVDEMNYMAPILSQWGFLGIMLPIFFWLPETPAYYAARGEDDKGIATLRRVNGKVPGFNVEEEYAIIRHTVIEEQGADKETEAHSFKQLTRSYAECFNRQNLRRTIGSTVPICAQQLTGLSFLNNYASLFFRQIGFSNAFLVTTIMTAISLFTATSLILITDKFGRRPVVFVSAVGCTLAMLLVGVLGLLEKTMPLQNFLIFVACVWSFFSNALDTEGANWGYHTAWLFFGAGLFSCVMAWFFVPEPSRRNAAELDELYAKNIPAWRMHKYVTEVQLDYEHAPKEEQMKGAQ